MFQGLILAILIAVLYFRIVPNLVTQWIRDPNYSHGFIVPLFSSWIVWKDRKRLIALRPEPSWFGILIIVSALLILVVGVLGAENFLSRTSLIFLIAGLIVYFRGWVFFRAVTYGWATLFLMVPIPAIIFNQIALPLQFQASWLASVLLGLLGIPVLREGNIIHLPAITLDVAEACSGVRSLVSLLTLAVVFGQFFERRTSRRLLLVLSAIPIAVIANGFRIMGSGVLGEYGSPAMAEGFFHTFSGLLIFLLSLCLMVAFHFVLSRFGNRSVVRRA